LGFYITTKSSATWLFATLIFANSNSQILANKISVDLRRDPMALRILNIKDVKDLPFRIFALILFFSSIIKYTISIGIFQEAPSFFIVLRLSLFGCAAGIVLR